MRNELVCALLLATGCVADPETSDEATDDATGEANGPIFPDDELPQYSCALGIATSCPSTINFSINAPINFISGQHQTRAISQTAVAAISADGSTIQCQISSAHQITNIPSVSVFLPSGVSAVRNAANTGVYFRDARNRSVEVKGSAFAPHGPDACAILCDLDNPEATVCNDPPPTSHDDATITVDGRTRSVDMLGQVETLHTEPLTDETIPTCKLTLPADRVAVRKNARPRDIVGVNRGRFVRGFELRGAALQTACADIANRVCAGNASCASARTTECVQEFSGPDPCNSSVPR